MKNLNKKGISLIIAVAIMLICSVLGVMMTQLLGVTSRGSVDYLRSTQALGLAQAGLNWQMMQSASTVDWDTLTSQTASLGGWIFTTSLSNWAQPQADSTTATRIDIGITGQTTSASGTTIQRTMSQRSFKLPSASKFAIFWGRRTGSTLTLTNVAITGNYWSQGTTAIPGTSSVTDGIAYRPSTEDISGAGSYTEQSITYDTNFGYFGNNDASFTSTFSTPSITTTYYTTLISGYDTAIATSASSTGLSQSSGTFNVSGIMRRINVSLTGTVTITGNGTLIANGSSGSNGTMTLGSTSGGPVTIRPDAGGSITFLSRRSMTVNNVTISNTNNPSPDYYPRVRMYSQAAGATSDLLTIRNTAILDRAFLLSDRRILVQNSTTSPVVTDSVLFVDYNSGSATNNNLTVTGTATVGNSASGPCSLISIARGTPALAITTTASVRGLVYQRDTGNAGFTNIAGTSSASRVNITGSIIANQFTSNAMSNANITYDSSAVADPPPEGFNNFAPKDPNSWSGN